MNLPRFTLTIAFLGISASFVFSSPSRAMGGQEIRFENHHFIPQTVEVTAGKPVVLKVINASKEAIEFESFKLNREVAMTPGETITVRLPALSPGRYDFYDDFHQDVPEGSIVAK